MLDTDSHCDAAWCAHVAGWMWIWQVDSPPVKVGLHDYLHWMLLFILFFFYIDSEPHRRHLGEDIKPRKGPKSLLVGFLSLHGCLAVTIVVVVKWLVHVAVLGGGVSLPRDKRSGWAEKSRDGLF